jgi:hypothetical protein
MRICGISAATPIVLELPSIASLAIEIILKSMLNLNWNIILSGPKVVDVLSKYQNDYISLAMEAMLLRVILIIVQIG